MERITAIVPSDGFNPNWASFCRAPTSSRVPCARISRYGRLSASDVEVEEAARLVIAHGFISRMEHGYEAQVGEGGNRLSTGQRQLLSFARALIANPQIFIMDEATSSIDTED